MIACVYSIAFSTCLTTAENNTRSTDIPRSLQIRLRAVCFQRNKEIDFVFHHMLPWHCGDLLTIVCVVATLRYRHGDQCHSFPCIHGLQAVACDNKASKWFSCVPYSKVIPFLELGSYPTQALLYSTQKALRILNIFPSPDTQNEILNRRCGRLRQSCIRQPHLQTPGEGAHGRRHSQLRAHA